MEYLERLPRSGLRAGSILPTHPLPASTSSALTSLVFLLNAMKLILRIVFGVFLDTLLSQLAIVAWYARQKGTRKDAARNFASTRKKILLNRERWVRPRFAFASPPK